MWLIVSALSPHNLHLLFCCVLSILASVLIAVFWVAIRRDSISLFRLPFLSHVQVFSCKISLVCCLTCLYICFSSYFCFLVIFVPLMLVLSVLFLVAVISLLPRFFISSFSHCIDTSMVRPLPSFLSTYNLSTSPMGCKALCIVVWLRHLWDVRPYASTSVYVTYGM